MKGTAGTGCSCVVAYIAFIRSTAGAVYTWLSAGLVRADSIACTCTMAASISLLLPATDPDISAGDVQRLPVDEAGRELASCAFIDLLHRRTRNIHLRGTLLVRLLFQINETDDLVLIECQQNRITLCGIAWTEPLHSGCTAYSTASWRSRHRCILLCFRYIPIMHFCMTKVNLLSSLSKCRKQKHHTRHTMRTTMRSWSVVKG